MHRQGRRILALCAVLVLAATMAASSAAAATSKSIDSMTRLSESKWRDLLKSGCVTITYDGPNQVASLCPSSMASMPAGVPSARIEDLRDLSEKSWLSMLSAGACIAVLRSDGAVTATLCPPGRSMTTPQGTTASGAPQPQGASTAPASPAPAPSGTPLRPSDILDLSNWYLGIPVNTSHDGAPDIIRQPELDGYSSVWFHANAAGDGVVFDANAGGYTTSGSSYPRTELREMSGSSLASWDSRSGTHTLEVSEAITQVTPVKPDIVAAQIHDSSDDVIEIRLQGSVLAVHSNDGKTKTPLDTAYQLGARFDLKIVADSGGIDVYYNGVLKTTVKASGSGYYFKAGAYVQSNPSKGEDPDAIGEVVIYDLAVRHS